MSSRTIAARALIGAALIGGLSLPATAPAAADGPPAPFAGTAVQGVDLEGAEQVPDDAPTLSPGVYRDKLTSSEEGWRAYRVERTAPATTLHVSLTTRPTSYGDSSDYNTEDLRIRLLAPDGTECYDDEGYAGESSSGTTPFVTLSGVVVGRKPPSSSTAEPSCRATGTFTVLLGRDGPSKTLQAEIQVLEEPPVGDLQDLPKGVAETPDAKDLTASDPTSVTGGTGFTDAPEVTPGTWTDTLEPGQTRVYRVRVDYGQTARFTVNGPTGGFRYPSDSFDSLGIAGVLYAPDRTMVEDPSAGSYGGGYNSPSSVTTSEVRYRNRFEDYTWPSRMGGWYYYAVNIGTADLGKSLKGQQIKVAFTVEVDGSPSKKVDYDLTAGDWGDASEGSSTDIGAVLPWLGGGVVLLVLLGGSAWLLIRRLT